MIIITKKSNHSAILIILNIGDIVSPPNVIFPISAFFDAGSRLYTSLTIICELSMTSIPIVFQIIILCAFCVTSSDHEIKNLITCHNRTQNSTPAASDDAIVTNGIIFSAKPFASVDKFAKPLPLFSNHPAFGLHSF